MRIVCILIFITFLFLGLNLSAQNITTPVLQLTKELHNETDPPFYVLSDSVKIESGKEEMVMVFFKAKVPVNIWNTYVTKYENKEKELFSWIASMLSIKAKYILKNNLSFEPFNNQFFMYYETDKMFICSYKMMGRNGYGNMVETSQLIKYDVEPDFKK